MNAYLELYSDIEETAKYMQLLCNLKLDEEDLKHVIEKVSEVHALILTESEVQTILTNLIRSRS
jgi:hypothetical protein